MEKRILVVEDDLSMEPILRRMLAKLDVDTRIDWATNSTHAMSLIRKRKLIGDPHDYSLILADVSLNGTATGLDLIAACRKAGVDSDFVVTSSQPQSQTSLPFLAKPISLAAFSECVRRSIAKADLTSQQGFFLDIEDPARLAELHRFYWVIVALCVAYLLFMTSTLQGAVFFRPVVTGGERISSYSSVSQLNGGRSYSRGGAES